MSRIELEPMICPNPECEGEHGLTGQLLPDDVVIRVSAAADGPDASNRAAAFARTLSAATAVASA